MGTYSFMSENEAKLPALAAIASLLEQVDGDLGIALSRTLLQTALRPGLSINELAEYLGVPQQTASRYIAVLQGRYEQSSVSLTVSARKPLLTLKVSQIDPRRRAIFLTTEGKKRIDKLLTDYSRDHEKHSGVGQSETSLVAERLDRDRDS